MNKTSARTSSPKTPYGPLSEAQRIAGLSLFWSEARYNFANFDHVPGLDWNRAYLEFLRTGNLSGRAKICRHWH